jgi:hypothetical protein
MANGNGFTAEQVIEAVKDSRGFVSTIAKRLGCQRTYVYKLAEKFASVKQAIEEEREGVKDFAEGKLLEQINVGNITAIIFYLKTQGKDRGYIERQELSGIDGNAITIKVEYADSNSSPEKPTS